MNIYKDILNNRFFVTINDKVAYIEYIQTNNTFEVTHTEVPSELSGKGIGSLLVQYAFEYAQNNDMKFVPTCQYAIDWHTKHHFNRSPKEL